MKTHNGEPLRSFGCSVDIATPNPEKRPQRVSKREDLKRVGTWNLEGRWSRSHEARLLAAACDVWLLTELHVGARELPGYRIYRSKDLMTDDRHWAAIAARDDLVVSAWDCDPHPASVAADVDGVTYCASVLPWRSCGTAHPWHGRTVAAKTQAATTALTAALPAGNTVWGGDWNHALVGPEYAGSLAGRQAILDAVAALGLNVVTADLPHRLAGLFTIDHVAVPAGVAVTHAERLPMAGGRRSLSDHDAYVVEIALPHRWNVYVIDVRGLGPKQLYVGQTWFAPAERRRQHADGFRAARILKREGVEVGELRPELLPNLPPLLTQEDALLAERTVAELLRAQGYTVHGGH